MIRVLLLAALAAAPLAGLAAAGDDAGKQLAARRGCDICHETLPRTGDAKTPMAPSYGDIGKRYKGRKGAEDRLVASILAGSGGRDQRHWAGRARFERMPANVLEINEQDARAIVRWILR